MSYLIERFGTVALPIYNTTYDLGTGLARTAVLDLAGGGAYDAMGSDRARRGQQAMRFIGTVYDADATAWEQAVEALRALHGKRDKLYRRKAGTRNVEWIYARLVDEPAMRRIRNRRDLVVELSFVLLSASWFGVDHGTAWTFDSGSYFDTGRYFDRAGPITLNTSPKSITLANSGNADVSGAVITIAAVPSNITSVTVKNVAPSGKVTEWTYSGTILAGQSLVVDCGAQSVKNDGANAYHQFARTANHQLAEWLRLEPGDNAITVTFTGGGGTSTILFDYYDGWV